MKRFAEKFFVVNKVILNYVSPHEMGRHIDFSSVVCLSVRLSVTLLCPLYIF